MVLDIWQLVTLCLTMLFVGTLFGLRFAYTLRR